MQLLLPFVSANDSNDVSCFLVEREDANRRCQSKNNIPTWIRHIFQQD